MQGGGRACFHRDALCYMLMVVRVSWQRIGPVFKGQSLQEDGTDRLTRNVRKQLVTIAAWKPRRPKTQFYSGESRKPRIAIFFQVETAPSGPGPPHYREFTIILRHTTFERTHLDERSATPLPINTQHSQQTSMPPVGFEHAIPVS